jgi:hypothetical protein
MVLETIEDKGRMQAVKMPRRTLQKGRQALDVRILPHALSLQASECQCATTPQPGSPHSSCRQ